MLGKLDITFKKMKYRKPNEEIKFKLVVQEEDKLKIMWGPADIERWLQTGKRSSSTQRAIEIDSYEVTIFPAESVKVSTIDYWLSTIDYR